MDVLRADDLPALQRMLSIGQIKPWDRFEDGLINRNLIEVRYQPALESVQSADTIGNLDGSNLPIRRWMGQHARSVYNPSVSAMGSLGYREFQPFATLYLANIHD